MEFVVTMAEGEASDEKLDSKAPDEEALLNNDISTAGKPLSQHSKKSTPIRRMKYIQQSKQCISSM